MKASAILALISLPALSAQLVSEPQSLDQALRAQYRITRVGVNGVVVGKPGTILLIQEDGIGALPAALGYWHNGVQGQRVSQSFGHAMWNRDKAVDGRTLTVGEWVYVTNIEVRPADVTFFLQTYGQPPDYPPYRARLTIHLKKGQGSKEVMDAAAWVFGIAPPEQKEEK